MNKNNIDSRPPATPKPSKGVRVNMGDLDTSTMALAIVFIVVLAALLGFAAGYFAAATSKCPIGYTLLQKERR